MVAVQQLINDIGREGIQDQSRYNVSIGSFVIPSSFIISADLPGPKYDLANINYFEGNQFHRLPVGIRFEDPLIFNLLVPEFGNSFFTSLSNYMGGVGIKQPNGGIFFGQRSQNYFEFSRNAQGVNIQVTAITKKNEVGKIYNYRNCFLEKVLPIKFDSSQAQPLYTTLIFAVGGMA